MATHILLVGSEHDPHLAEVANLVSKLGYQVLQVHPDSTESFLTLGFGSTRSEIRTGQRTVALSEIAGVWFRQKPLLPAPDSGALTQAAVRFRQAEWRAALLALEIAAPRAIWVNHPHAQAAISSKPAQLWLASECGFNIPGTAVTNDAEAVSRLFDRYEKVIYKPLTWTYFPDQTGIMTNLISRDQVNQERTSIGRAPGIFQQFIEKECELRVTVVGSEIFTAKIRTNASEPEYIDWRRSHLNEIFDACELDTQIARQATSFLSRAGLEFGAFDLVVDRGGSTFFLECNPAGQYLWLKELAGLDISPAVARLLTSAAGESQS